MPQTHIHTEQHCNLNKITQVPAVNKTNSIELLVEIDDRHIIRANESP